MASTCISCSEAAQFSYQTSPNTFMLFCFNHVPGFLKGKSGNLLLKAIPPEEPAATSTKTSKKKKSEATVEEPAVDEEITTEEVSVEEPVTEE